MLGQRPDAIREQRNLHLGRARVRLVEAVGPDEVLGVRLCAARSFSHILLVADGLNIGSRGCLAFGRVERQAQTASTRASRQPGTPGAASATATRSPAALWTRTTSTSDRGTPSEPSACCCPRRIAAMVLASAITALYPASAADGDSNGMECAAASARRSSGTAALTS